MNGWMVGCLLDSHWRMDGLGGKAKKVRKLTWGTVNRIAEGETNNNDVEKEVDA